MKKPRLLKPKEYWTLPIHEIHKRRLELKEWAEFELKRINKKREKFLEENARWLKVKNNGSF